MPDAAYLPLSRRQKAVLCQLARTAYGDGPAGAAYEAWRHEQARRACHRRISEARQEDYLSLKAHFEDLAGQPDRALNTLLREHSNGRRIAMHKLGQECSRAGLFMDYAAAICRRQFRCPLAEASERQLWNLVYTIRNRAASRNRRRCQ